ncbi:MAG: VWA domain-containing protein, partial [Saprospiraceae bacterium]|nr:VWA domain-containing protein [Saprospiraceae bacterium]
ENTFKRVADAPLTTFSIDVDRAAYSNVRRFLNDGLMPPVGAVRVEEMINYFHYDYTEPTGAHPFEVGSTVVDSPWNPDLKLVHIGLQGKRINTAELPPSNLVFLLDVSGSMSSSNKLPLVKSAFNLLVDQLRPEDQVAIVVYAGAAGMVLPPTSGAEKMKLKEAINNLNAGGSTAGGAGIKLAYKTALKSFIEGGNNRVVLATDGDFNVGVSSDAGLQELIEEKRDQGVFLSVLGFGMGNYKDNKMEVLADKGNGNYAYIDNFMEAKKVFVNEFGGTLFTIAKDVKLQVEFNPKQVEAYRLIGYENRKLNNEDFNDDQKDAGDMGAGHSVTAIYEVVPRGVTTDYVKAVDALKYQKTDETKASKSDEWMTVKLRYKQPDAATSVKFEHIVRPGLEEINNDAQFSIAVAQFGLLLRDSEFKGQASYDAVIELAKKSKGDDEEGYRAEFIKLVKAARLIDNRTARK